MSDEERTQEGDGYEEERQRLEEKRPACSVNLEPLEDWIKKDTNFCRPCILPVTIDWYRQELAERGHQDLVEEIDRARLSEDSEATCRAMDAIKEKVPLDLKYRLMEFDCSTQEHAAQLETELEQPDEASLVPSQPEPGIEDIESEIPPEPLPPEPQETEL